LKTLLLGNAGAGKSTLAKQLLEREPASRLSLDELAFLEEVERRPLEESVAEALRFIESNESWIIEGCYGDIVEPLLQHANTLIFLNPGVETCVAHCQARPWEPEKFESREAQDANLQNLINWVREYEFRDDEYGLKRHRALFDAFKGRKVEYNQPSEYQAV
jgi:adenylate kinase family enzyme